MYESEKCKGWQEAAEVGRDQVTQIPGRQAKKPGLDPEGQQSSSFTGTQESDDIPTCDILHGPIQDLDS